MRGRRVGSRPAGRDRRDRTRRRDLVRRTRRDRDPRVLSGAGRMARPRGRACPRPRRRESDRHAVRRARSVDTPWHPRRRSPHDPLAMLFAFWPAGSGRTGRTLGLSLLVALYATSVTWEAPSAELARGAFLFLFVAAVLWLPRASMRRAVARRGLDRSCGRGCSSARVSCERLRPAHLVHDVERLRGRREDRLQLESHVRPTRLASGRNGGRSRGGGRAHLLEEPMSSTSSTATRGVAPSDAFGELGDGYELAGSPDELVAAHPEWMQTYTVRMTALQSRLAVTSGTRPEIEGARPG